MANDIERLGTESEDLVADRIRQLCELFPEIDPEGDSHIDFNMLRLVLGDAVNEGDERYAFTWPGKANAIRQGQTTSKATLRPALDESSDWDTTKNLYIEGDNLEVLKLLQRAYHGQVKMIYIDPPYNTGTDFVYEDSFTDTIGNYKTQAGLAGQSNPETNGRYHTRWCNLIYPRIRLARELLLEDGLLFVSIGNQEISNLKEICDEIFGAACCLGIIAWESKTKCQNTATAKRQLQPKQEYILVYRRTAGRHEFGLEVLQEKTYDQIDENGNPFRYKRIEEMAAGGVRGRTTMVFPILGVMPSDGKQWKLGHETIEAYESRGDLLLMDGVPHFRCRPDDEEDSFQPFWSLITKDIGTAETAKSDLKKLMGDTGFETVKPVALIKKLIMHACSGCDDAIVLDFFSGSATTAHAVMEWCADTSSNLRYILVQLPEVCAEGSDSKRAGYNNICEIGKERIRRAAAKIKEEIEEQNKQLMLGMPPKELPDLGFRVLKLDDSNFDEPKPGELVLDIVKQGRSDLDIVFECMLRWGLDLTLPVEKGNIGGYPCYSVAADELICCMESGLTEDTFEAIAERSPKRVLIRDSILDDTLKLNAVAVFGRGTAEGDEIDLRTV